jgi:hypothetical protein
VTCVCVRACCALCATLRGVCDVARCVRRCAVCDVARCVRRCAVCATLRGVCNVARCVITHRNYLRVRVGCATLRGVCDIARCVRHCAVCVRHCAVCATLRGVCATLRGVCASQSFAVCHNTSASQSFAGAWDVRNHLRTGFSRAAMANVQKPVVSRPVSRSVPEPRRFTTHESDVWAALPNVQNPVGSRPVVGGVGRNPLFSSGSRRRSPLPSRIQKEKCRIRHPVGLNQRVVGQYD